MSDGDGSTAGLIQPAFEAICQITISSTGTTAMRARTAIRFASEVRLGSGVNSERCSASERGTVRLIGAAT